MKPIVITEDDKQRFWIKVDKNGPIPIHRPELGQCWVWTAARLPNGYGRLGFGRSTRLAHRVSWNIHFGEIPEGILVMHRCDRTFCVRPEHLSLGNHADNSADCVSKGRYKNGMKGNTERAARGERHGSKINPECVLRGDKHPFRIRPELVKTGEHHGMSKINETEVLEIRALLSKGIKQADIGRIYNISNSQVSSIKTKHSWKHLP